MPGSTDNPVKFANPFQRIVGVHWRDDDPAAPPLAFSILIRLGAVSTVPGEQCAPIYYSPFGTPNSGLYHPDVAVPKSWGGWVYYEEGGWVDSPGHLVDGLPDFGSSPYALGSDVPTISLPIALSMQWTEPGGGPLGFETPIQLGEDAPRTFQAGTASVVGVAGGGTSMTIPDITVQFGDYNFAYAGAVTLFQNTLQPLNALVDNRALCVLLLPVTA